MLKYIRYVILLVLIGLSMPGCRVPHPANYTGISGHTRSYHYRYQPRYRYIDKRVCRWKHGRQHCRIVRVKVIVR
jgi:hypothetical protein